MLGDYTIDLMMWLNHLQTTDCIDTINVDLYINLIHLPTRLTSSTAAIIDDIFTYDFAAHKDSLTVILDTNIAHHNPFQCLKNRENYGKWLFVPR